MSWGAISGVAADATEIGSGQTAFGATQPAGSAVAVTPSEFSLKGIGVRLATGVKIGADDGGGGGFGIGADVGVGVGVPGVGVGVTQVPVNWKLLTPM
jgi:hypothetical protein